MESNSQESFMGTYRTSRPLLVEAVQSAEAKTIATDLGFVNVRQGEWVIRGERGECYIVDDAFFRRTFVPVDVSQAPRSGGPERTLLMQGARRAATPVAMRRSKCRRPVPTGSGAWFERGAPRKRK